MTDIFVSYASDDRSRVIPLVRAFRDLQWVVWWDQEILTGEKYPKVIQERLEDARVIVGVYSRNSLKSEYFLGETHTAWQRGALFPILFDVVDLPSPINVVQSVNLVGWTEDNLSNPEFAKLTADLRRRLGSRAKSTEPIMDEGARFEARFKESDPPAGGAGSPAGEKEPPDKADGTSSKKEPESAFSDPSEELQAGTEAALYRFPEPTVRSWARHLLSERLIGIRSPSEEVTSAAAESLLAMEELKGYDGRLLTFTADTQLRTDLSLENLIRQGIGRPNQATVLVVGSRGALPFIETTFFDRLHTRSVTRSLKARDLLFIVQIGSRYWKDLEKRFGAFSFGCWDVDWLEPLLNYHLREGPEDEVLRVLGQLTRQRRNGDWGNRNDDQEFHDLLQLALKTGPVGLKKAIEQRESPGAVPAKRQPALDAFRTGIGFYRGLLFCAVYFPGLDVKEFRRVCLAIAGDEKVFVQEISIDQSGREVAMRRESTLREEWRTVADDAFRRCGIDEITTLDHPSVTFVEPEERGVIASCMDGEANYFSDAVDRLWAAGFFFDSDASAELVDNMTALFVSSMRRDRTRSQPQWLSNTLIEQRGEDHESSDELVLIRISRLLRALLARSGDTSLVTAWLNNVRARIGDSEALRLVNHLRILKGFDYLHSLKRFSNESPADVRWRSYWSLYWYARQTSQIWDLFSELESWLPKDWSAGSLLSKSSQDALRLFVEYSFDTESALKPEDVARWPSRYPLFRDLALDAEPTDADRERRESHLKSLMLWLFHPALPGLLVGDTIASAWVVRAQLIMRWSYILLGIDKDLIYPEAWALYRRILALCRQNVDTPGRRQLVEVWKKQEEEFLAERRARSGAASRYFAARYRLLKDLREDFNNTDAGQRQSQPDIQHDAWNTAQF